jgi:hypothetical protein
MYVHKHLVFEVQPNSVLTHSSDVININTQDSMQDNAHAYIRWLWPHSYIMLLVSKFVVSGVISA